MIKTSNKKTKNSGKKDTSKYEHHKEEACCHERTPKLCRERATKEDPRKIFKGSIDQARATYKPRMIEDQRDKPKKSYIHKQRYTTPHPKEKI
jgi:hypothetical protein